MNRFSLFDLLNLVICLTPVEIVSGSKSLSGSGSKHFDFDSDPDSDFDKPFPSFF